MRKLKYYFTVQYKDGTIYQQNEQDVSVKDPCRSCFYDVDQENVKQFTLSDKNNWYAVDVVTGEFIVNWAKFKLHTENSLTNRRLVYFRRVVKDFNTAGDELGEQITYFLGWQANTPEGKNVQYTLAIE